jgi:tetratricopeptide (TPR) repeat protein
VTFQQALALHRQGRVDEAASAYEKLLLAEPAHLDALVHLGALRLGQGRAEEAEVLLRRATTVSPESPEALGNLGATLQALGRHEEAAARYEQALAHRPGMQDARFGLAVCLQASARYAAALTSYEAILDAEPAHVEANYGLATLLVQLGRVDEAVAKYRAALIADPDFAEASYELGKLLARGDKQEEAIHSFLQAVDVDPDYIEARVALGTTLSQLHRDDEAMAAFRAVLAGEPDHSSAHNGIGILLDRQRRHAEAIEHYRAALVRTPEHADAMAGMANAMKNIGQHDEALTAARRVLALRPDFAPAAGLLGSVLAEIGSMDEALEQFRRAVTLAPERPEFAYHLVQLAKVQPGDAALHALETALFRAPSLSAQDQCLLHFGLAKAYDDIGERDRGFSHLLQGNAIKRVQADYDEAATLGAMDQIPRVFTAELMAARRTLGDPSTSPVFIVGMPRSGTTLVEQTLASHKAVFGAGERPELSQAIKRLSAERLGARLLPQTLWTMTGEQLRKIGAEYVAALRPLAPGAARITDKMPTNFLHVGLICLILPNARIIHVLRDPVDTCLSCFSKMFADGQTFTYDLAELGRFYRAYQSLMAHWRAAVPPGVMLEVEYEALVEDFESHARRIVAHCDLPWDPSCLEFHKTSRPVHTASMVQVRQPIYRSSVGRWRPDATLLRPLLEALAIERRTE